MLYTTPYLAREAFACHDGYKVVLDAWGSHEDDTEIPLDFILEKTGLLNAVWALRCTTKPSDVAKEFYFICLYMALEKTRDLALELFVAAAKAGHDLSERKATLQKQPKINNYNSALRAVASQVSMPRIERYVLEVVRFLYSHYGITAAEERRLQAILQALLEMQ